MDLSMFFAEKIPVSGIEKKSVTCYIRANFGFCREDVFPAEKFVEDSLLNHRKRKG